MTEAYDALVQPRPPSAEQIESMRQIEGMRRQSEFEQAARDRSWVDFVDQLRSAPEQLCQLLPPGPDFVDVRLHRLWVLLRSTVGRDARFAIDSVAGLEPMLGPEITESVHDGLVRHWRAGRPLLKSAREPAKRNNIRPLDCMGITGVTLEAKGSDRWAARLTSAEAVLAASYATLEINGSLGGCRIWRSPNP